MKIIELKSENFKKLKAVEIKPNGNVVTLTGKNGSGKTSILDSILSAFKGKALPGKPIREGEKKAKIEIDCGEFVVTRSITPSGNTVTVKNKEGFTRSSPQQFLDEVVGHISFDPMQFINHDNKKQHKILMDLVGINVEQFDSKIKEEYDARKLSGQELKQLNGQLSGLSRHEDAPLKEISSPEFFKKLEEAQINNAEIDYFNESIDYHNDLFDNRIKEIAELTAKITELEKINEESKQTIQDCIKSLSNMEVIDIENIKSEISTIDETNQKVRDNQKYEEVEAKFKSKKEEYLKKTSKIEDLEKQKTDALEKAKFPIKGLSFSNECVTFNGIPLNQISAAEKIKVGLSVSMALNPKLKVLRITDGSLLDSESFKIIEDMAKDKDYQVWIEKVDESGDVGFYIEDGEIAKNRTEKQQELL